jgi:hypothetical protein
MILQEFDQIIERNDFVDDKLLDVVFKRLWAVDSEEKKRALIHALTGAAPTLLPPRQQQVCSFLDRAAVTWSAHRRWEQSFSDPQAEVAPLEDMEGWLAKALRCVLLCGVQI